MLSECLRELADEARHELTFCYPGMTEDVPDSTQLATVCVAALRGCVRSAKLLILLLEMFAVLLTRSSNICWQVSTAAARLDVCPHWLHFACDLRSGSIVV